MKLGKRTIKLNNPPNILGYATVVGEKEEQGPLSGKFDEVFKGDANGEDSFEQEESKMQERAANLAISKSGCKLEQINMAFAGDLLNQCIGSNYSMRSLGIPFCGIYGACSNMSLSMILAALMINADYADFTLAMTSSHFCAAERQFRFPLEYGGQRTPTSQWTATASGAVVIGYGEDDSIRLTKICLGKIVDANVSDINNMGAAMAPAAADTITAFFKDTKTSADDYDLILTGDLGEVGSTLLCKLMESEGFPIKGKHSDCGILLFDKESQDVHAGGSGCGCSAAVLCSDIFPKISKGELKKVLFIATGALMSTVSTEQGESIPSIAQLVLLEGK